MIDAGVTLFGKTNVPLMLADWQSYNEIYGTTNNPWDLAAHARRLVGRLGRGAGGRPDRHRGRQRHRRLDPQPRALLRRVRPQADLGRGLAQGPRAGRHASPTATSPWSDRWRAAPRISRSRWMSWPAPTRSTAAAGRSACRAPRRRSLRDFKVAVLLTDPNAEVDALGAATDPASSPTSSPRARPR